MTILEISNRADFRKWLLDNHNKETECYIKVKRGCPSLDAGNLLWYIDAVEEALCFGWIDSTTKNGIQRFSPRRSNGNWTELNKARCIRLRKLGLMTQEGEKELQKAKDFIMDGIIENKLKEAGAWDIFLSFPKLYQRIRISNLVSHRKRNVETYEKSLKHFIAETLKGHIYGNWNDYGRIN